MKYTTVCLGLQAANAKHSCIWCKCPKQFRHSTSNIWENEIRTIKEIQQFCPKEKYGCIHQPLLPSIPIDHVMPDIMHLFLKINDILIYFLTLKLRKINGTIRSIHHLRNS